MNKRLAGHVATLVLALGVVSPAFAQRMTGTLVGTVKDDTGGVLPGVTVSLTGEKIAGTQTATTNEEGFYRFPALPPGNYDLAFSLAGFGTLRRQGVKLSLGATEEVERRLEGHPARRGGDGRRRRSGRRHPDQPGQHQLRQGLGAQRARAALQHVRPARGRRPGVSQSSQGSTTMSAFGSGTDENSFQIDGTNLTASSTGEAWPYPNTDAIEEIEVLALGAPAEYGNVTGAVFNIVTRQGTNDFHGDANYYFQSDGLTSRNTTAEEECRAQRRGGLSRRRRVPLPPREVPRRDLPALGPHREGQALVLRLLPVPDRRQDAGGSRPAVLHRREGAPGLREAQLEPEPEAQVRPRLPQRLLRPALYARAPTPPPARSA